MDSIKCKGCAKSFPINGIRTHIGRTSCKNQFTSAEYDQLVKLCESHKRKRKADIYKQNKIKKNVQV